MQHYVYVAWNVQTFGLCVPRFLQQVDILVLLILSNNLKTNFLTPQEVGDWFGCEEKKRIMFSKKKGILLFLFSKEKKKEIYF